MRSRLCPARSAGSYHYNASRARDVRIVDTIPLPSSLIKKKAMKVILAFDSFKGSLSSARAAEAAACGIREIYPRADITSLLIADGGEGTAAALAATWPSSRKVIADVTDPLGRPIQASYIISAPHETQSPSSRHEKVLIETAAASGLTLLTPCERNPGLTSSFGTGLLIRDALRQGCRDIIIGLGGSATNDAGAGMLAALGWRFIDTCGNTVSPCGASLSSIAAIDDSSVLPELEQASFHIATDVFNPLTGPEGASRVFAPQKGADSEMVARLDAALSHFASLDGRQRFASIPGAGAAGGLGFAFLAFLRASISSGIDLILDANHFDRLITGADLIITGEGHIDAQTLMGKAPAGILARAGKKSIPVVAFAGSLDITAREGLINAGFIDVIPVSPPHLPLSVAMDSDVAARNLSIAVARFIKNFY